jgi:hypothetical protein
MKRTKMFAGKGTNQHRRRRWVGARKAVLMGRNGYKNVNNRYSLPDKEKLTIMGEAAD